MRYSCTIYTHTYSFGGTDFRGTEPTFQSPIATVEVNGETMRQAAAQAYVRCVGSKRARLLRKELPQRPNLAALEKSVKTIAASLRRTCRRIGEVFELDHALEAWLIKVEPVPVPSPAPTRRPRPAVSRLLHLSRTPFPN